MSKQIGLSLITLGFLALGVLAWFFLFPLSTNEGGEEGVSRLRIGSETFALEIAQTQEERLRGLSDRDELCSHCGMLFVFEKAEKHGFWMKDMRFPIDIVWLRGEEIVWVEHSIPPDSKKTLYPPVASDRVLELAAGQATGFKIGERVKFLP